MRQLPLQLMALPGLIWLLVFAYIPMSGIIIAFKNYRVIDNFFTAPWAFEAGFEHFIRIFHDRDFFNALFNTLGISFLKLLIGFPVPIIFALLLNELRTACFRRWVQTISYLPHFLSWVILGGMMINWLGEGGIVNELLLRLGLLREPFPFLGQPQGFWRLAVFSDLWKELGWGAIIYLAAMGGIAPEFYEAARIDGANRFAQVRHITLPCISGTITVLFILTIGGILNTNFEQMLILGNPLNAEASSVIDTYVYYRGIQGGEYSFSTAVGLFKALVALALLLSANWCSKKIQGKGLF